MSKQSILRTAVAASVIGCIMAASAYAQEVGNNSFTVTVPEEIAAICDVEVSDDEVAFYESLSHSEYGGFVAGICLYESVKDYGNLPSFRRGGQIVAEDGSKQDVVLLFASDVQFDIENEESRENYSLISEAMEGIAASMVPAQGVYTPQDEIDTTSIYADVLDTLRADVEKQAEPDVLDADGFSYLYHYLYNDENPLSVIGYQYIDINLDGYSELCIGSLQDNAIYDLYTQQDGEVIHVFAGGERDIHTLVGDQYGYHTIKEYASGGANLTSIFFCLLDPVLAGLDQEVTFIYDADTYPENPCRIVYFEGDEGEPVSEDEWNERMSYFGEDMQMEYTPLG